MSMDISEELDQLTARNDLLQDPTRFHIYIQAFLRPEITAKDLLDIVDINRSTLSFHLTKMVDAGILEVSVPPTGRQVKSYSLKHRVHKLDIHPDSRSSKFTREEREKLLQYRINQMGFEFRLASKLIEQLPSEEHGEVEQIEVRSTRLEYTTNRGNYQLLNGGLFFERKDQMMAFMTELEQLITTYKISNFQPVEGVTKNYAFLIGAYPLPAEFEVEGRVRERTEMREHQ